MSVFRLTPHDREAFTIITNPIRSFVSSSTQGSTGSVFVFARRSANEKDLISTPAFVDASHSDDQLLSNLESVQKTGKVIRNSDSVKTVYSASFHSMLENYLQNVNAQSISQRKQKFIEVKRQTPTTQFTKNTLKKLIIKDQLNPYYRISNPQSHYAYTNYNSLNFFTSSTVPEGSALLYPNIEGGESHEGYVTGSYSLSGAFSFDFYLNPRYQPDKSDGEFHAGTIMHLSSSYAVSLVSGSSKDENGKPISFRIKLQLSHSADVSPSISEPGDYPNDLTFLSDDYSIWHNHWHHIVIRWGTNLINNGTGSFNIDGTDRGTFVIPSGTVAPKLFNSESKTPSVLTVGNYYEGNNFSTNSVGRFFSQDPATRDGLNQMNFEGSGIDEPSNYLFSHPLNAELHDLSLKRVYMSNRDIAVSSSVGPNKIGDEYAFYLPPFFIPDSPFRQSVNGYGGILQTPFFEVDGTTNDPFNVAMSFGVNGHYINIENYLKDFASNNFPRVHLMTASVLTETSIVESANDFLYESENVRRRNLLILPCDDGLFYPNFELLSSESLKTNYVDDLNVEELSFVTLDNLVNTSSLLFGTDFSGNNKSNDDVNIFSNELIGYTPEQPGLPAGPAVQNYQNITSGNLDPGIQAGAPLTIYQRTRDPSSNQVTWFDISNLYYGNKILPGSITISDESLSGSSSAFKITLKDDGKGNIYRADCATSASTWNSVGNAYYDEGIIFIKNPHLYFFGKEKYSLTFKGEQNIHVMKLNILAPSNQLNSSSNPNFKALPPTTNVNEQDEEFVYISGINIHDDNLNVIMKAQLAQPILKRHGDRILFKLKYDF